MNSSIFVGLIVCSVLISTAMGEEKCINSCEECKKSCDKLEGKFGIACKVNVPRKDDDHCVCRGHGHIAVCVLDNEDKDKGGVAGIHSHSIVLTSIIPAVMYSIRNMIG